MAYDPGTVIPYFSNPNVKYQGVATGDTTSANSARVINMTAASVAAYRSAGPVRGDHGGEHEEHFGVGDRQQGIDDEPDDHAEH